MNNFLRCFSLMSNTRFRMINLFVLPFCFSIFFVALGASIIYYLTSALISGTTSYFASILTGFCFLYLSCFPINNPIWFIIITKEFDIMEVLKVLIDIDKAFGCASCKKIALDPFVTNCCESIVCRSCIIPGLACKGCMSIAKFRKSPVLQRIYECTFR